MEKRKGQCMCGAVRFSARVNPTKVHVCHCEQCRRWTGSALFAISAAKDDVEIEDTGAVRSFRSSDWASRSVCGTCGSALWYRFDEGKDGAGDFEIAIGLLEDASGLALEQEIFADQCPDFWAIRGDHGRLTRQETLALFGADAAGT
ncbi:GFA family protein [Primorskyibacter flagellatus]|uniref:Uncharacterized conserved protein n=1 Tax=Primorskyibacter flagellatus TaxID=1387277 RepID=A0A1W2AHC8_9RHOB|nr:GFA family protein [Primorskyibacter flagellatus]SMC59861.1 Uncharacterized conserved protein [Primorskyibacter flagellatus]